MISRKQFFDRVKSQELFTTLAQSQVDGMNTILDETERLGYVDARWTAYMLATAYHETDRTMQPIAERGSGKDRNGNGEDDHFEKYDQRTSLGNTPALDGDGAIWKGRGFVQLTGRANYETFQNLLNVPLLKNPELACKMDVAVRILIVGMIRGKFTGKRLQDYFNRTADDWINARKIINSLDRADDIAGYGKKFLDAIS
jgi:putative chitinase